MRVENLKDSVLTKINFMRWTTLSIFYFGLINISTQEIKVFSFCAIIITIFWVFYNLLPEDGYSQSQILNHKEEFKLKTYHLKNYYENNKIQRRRV